jgi:hypothetical protein
VVESQGVPIKTETVTHFRAPRFRLPAPPRVNLRHRAGKLKVRWSRVEGAVGYQALVDQSDGPTYSFRRRAKNRALVVGGLTERSGATVAVRAISPAGYIGKPGVARLSAPGPISAPRRLNSGRVLRTGGFGARCAPSGDGRCEIAVLRGDAVLARGARKASHGGSRLIRVKLTGAGRRALAGIGRRARLKARMRAEVPGDGRIELKLRFE